MRDTTECDTLWAQTGMQLSISTRTLPACDDHQCKARMLQVSSYLERREGGRLELVFHPRWRESVDFNDNLGQTSGDCRKPIVHRRHLRFVLFLWKYVSRARIALQFTTVTVSASSHIVCVRAT
jgi:hypothetical protein